MGKIEEEEMEEEELKEQRMFGANGYVGCRPFESFAIQKQGTGFVVAKQKNALLGTVVLFAPAPTETLHLFPGDEVFIEAENSTHEWARRAYEIEGGAKFILIPSTAIRVVRQAPVEPFVRQAPVEPFVRQAP